MLVNPTDRCERERGGVRIVRGLRPALLPLAARPRDVLRQALSLLRFLPALLAAPSLACGAPNNSGLFSPREDGGSGGTAGSGGSSPLGGAGGAGGGGGGGAAGSAATGGTASGGAGAGGGSGRGGSGGSATDELDGGASDASVGLADTGLDSGSGCGGTLVSGICFYLGALGESCDVACAARGGYDEAATALLGTTAQGGGLGDCAFVLDALLGTELAATTGTQSEEGLGCHLFADERWWLEAPPLTPDASATAARRACGCTR